MFLNLFALRFAMQREESAVEGNCRNSPEKMPKKACILSHKQYPWCICGDCKLNPYPNNPFVLSYPAHPSSPNSPMQLPVDAVLLQYFPDVPLASVWYSTSTWESSWLCHERERILHDTVDTVMYHHATVATDRAVHPTMTRMPYQLRADQSLDTPNLEKAKSLTKLTVKQHQSIEGVMLPTQQLPNICIYLRSLIKSTMGNLINLHWQSKWMMHSSWYPFFSEYIHIIYL